MVEDETENAATQGAEAGHHAEGLIHETEQYNMDASSADYLTC